MQYDPDDHGTTEESGDTQQQCPIPQAHANVTRANATSKRKKFLGSKTHRKLAICLTVLGVALAMLMLATAFEVFAARAKFNGIRPSFILREAESVAGWFFTNLGYYWVKVFDLVYLVRHIGNFFTRFWTWVYEWLAWLLPLSEIWLAMTDILTAASMLVASPLQTVGGWVLALKDSAAWVLNFYLWVITSLGVFAGIVLLIHRKRQAIKAQWARYFGKKKAD